MFERFQDRLAAVESEMRAGLLAEAAPSVGPFYGMMAYHLGWQDAAFQPVQGPVGKRLRPLLCLLACEVAGGGWEAALPAAAAVELVHNFSLIHDDIEDRSALRRGRPTVWSVWGVPQAINAGDGLFTLARAALLRTRGPARRTLQAIAVLDRAIIRLCEGQYLDLAFEGRLDVDEAAYTAMIARKTAALLEASLHLGALMGGGNRRTIRALRAYGQALGLAFQVWDDYLGIWGQEAHTGKPAAGDLYGRKLGLPAVHALSRAGEADRAVLARIYGGTGPVAEADVQAVLTVLGRTGTQAYVGQVAAEYHAQAVRALAGAPAGPPREALAEIAAALVGRTS